MTKHKLFNFQWSSAKDDEEARAKAEALAKETEEARIMEHEKARKSVEKYKIAKLPFGWGCLPILLFSVSTIGFFAYFFYSAYIEKSIDINTFVVPGILLWGLIFLISRSQEVEALWDKTLPIKAKIYPMDDEFKWFYENYKEEYIYTDSWFDYWTYRINKIVSYLLSLLTAGVIILLLCLWLSSLIIAPTTIIIILLVIIIAILINRYR